MNPKEAFQNTAYSVQLPYIAGLSLSRDVRTCMTVQKKVLVCICLLYFFRKKEDKSKIKTNIVRDIYHRR